MKTILRTALLAMVVLASSQLRAELVVVANQKSGIEQLSQAEVIHLFMGRLRQLPSGITSLPLDFPTESNERTTFYRQLVNKEPAEIRAYWSRLTFSGGSRPPQTVGSREDLIRIITQNQGALGYLDRSNLDNRVKVVFEFPPPR